MAVAPVRSRIGFRVVDALNAEWDRLAEGHHETVGEWGLRHPVLAACLDLPDVLQVARFDVDSVLRCLLVEQLESGDDLADRTVLQIMLGRVVLLALRDPYEDAGDYVSAMWCRIRTYPITERPTRIAANLALDALKTVKGERMWSRRAVEVATLPYTEELEELQLDTAARLHDHNVVSVLTASRVISAADRLGLIDEPTRAVLLTVYSDGLSGREAAGRHQTSAGMIRFRCSKAVRRLSEHATLLAEAA
jgi:DNA-directed RNA polymerase specialized sigma24 family protein